MSTSHHATQLAASAARSSPGFGGPPGLIRVGVGTEQYVATAAVLGLFVLFLYEVYRAGARLKDDHDDNLVEILQALVVTAGSILASLFVVYVWHLDQHVGGASQAFIVDPVTAILVIVSFITVAVTYTLTRVTKRLIRYSSGHVEVTPHQRELIHHAVQILLFLGAGAFVFALWDFDPTNLLLGAGALGIVLGFAARQTLSGVLSGFVILFGRPFEVGDWIAVGDREGIVTEITVYNTQIQTFNEEHVLVPNDSVTEREVVNYSKTDRLRIETEVGVDFDADLAEAATVATEAMESCASVADAPRPDVVIDSFGESAVVLRLRYWIDRPTITRKLSAKNEVIDAVKDAYRSRGIKIPYPKRELQGREETDGLRITTGSDPLREVDRDRAVRRVTGSDSTVVAEPVEDRYGDGGESDGDGVDADGTGTEAGDGDDSSTDVQVSADDADGRGDGRDGAR